MNMDINKIYSHTLDLAKRNPLVQLGLVCLAFVLIYKFGKEVGETIYYILHR